MSKLDLDECSIVDLVHNQSDVTVKVDDVNSDQLSSQKRGTIVFHKVQNVRIDQNPSPGRSLQMVTSDGEAIVFRIDGNSVEIVVEWKDWSKKQGSVKHSTQLIEFEFDGFEIKP